MAQALGAAQLVLIKPPGAEGPGVIDAHFDKVLMAGIRASTVSLADPWQIGGALGV